MQELYLNLNFQLSQLFRHETDFTIADFVADLRAPTPSAAAELAVPEISKIEDIIRNYQNRYRISLKKNVDYMKLRYEKCMQSRCYKDPLQGINEKYINIDMLVKGIVTNINGKITVSKKDFGNAVSKLDALSPLKTLSRGYSIVTGEDSKVIKKAKDLNKGDKITIRFTDNSVNAEVV